MACFLCAKLAPLTCTFGCGFEGSCAFHAEDSPTTEWRKDPEFSEAIEKATAERLLLRLNRIEAGEQGWQGTAWALERIYPHRFARPEVMNQIAVVQAGKAPERVIVLPSADFNALKGREGYRQRENGELERVEGSIVYMIMRSS
jgi:hypothetical protein